MKRKDAGLASNIVINFSENFKFIDKREIRGTSEALSDDTYLDNRMYLLSVHTDFHNTNWLVNYIETASYFAKVNKDSYPRYLLELGYIPVVYLPSCVPELGINMMQRLDALNIPYVKMKSTSFVQKWYNTDSIDAWVHKFDAAKVLGCKPEEVRSVRFLREVFGIGS